MGMLQIEPDGQAGLDRVNSVGRPAESGLIEPVGSNQGGWRARSVWGLSWIGLSQHVTDGSDTLGCL